MLCTVPVVRRATFSSVVCKRLWDVPGCCDQDVLTEPHQPTFPSQIPASERLWGRQVGGEAPCVGGELA